MNSLDLHNLKLLLNFTENTVLNIKRIIPFAEPEKELQGAMEWAKAQLTKENPNYNPKHSAAIDGEKNER